MKDTYRMGSHKLYWHLDRVNAWLDGKRITPIHIDVGLSKGCNIHCEYCYGTLQGNKYNQGAEQYFPREALLNYMRSAGECGVRSMGFIGEGEPLLNPHIYDAIEEGTKAGIDIALATNGVLFDLEEKGTSLYAPKTILRWKNDGIQMGQIDSGQTRSYLLSFSTPSVTDSKQGKTGLFDFEFDSLSL